MLGVTVNGTSVVDGTTKIAEISLATASTAATPKFGVVQTSSNITNTNGVISVPDATTAVKGVVQLADAVDGDSETASTDVPTVAAVATAINNLPEPMVFKGTVGTDGTVTWANLPGASDDTVGYTYKVITAHDTAPVCEVGDTIICADPQGDGTYEWVVVPSGDEPSGTVTSVQAAAVADSGLIMGTGASGASGSPITDSGTITVGVASGYEVPNTERTGHWDATYTKVNPYTDATPLIDGLAVSSTQTSSDGSVAIAHMGTGQDADTLIIDFIKPTISDTVTAVVKPIPTP